MFEFLAPVVQTVPEISYLLFVVFQLIPNRRNLLLHTLMVFAQVLYLLFDTGYLSISSIKLTLRQMQAIANDIMLSTLIFQALFCVAKIRGFEFEGRLQRLKLFFCIGALQHCFLFAG